MGRTLEQRALAAQGLRKCTLCKTDKLIECFSVKRHYYNKDGTKKYTSYDTRCKTCMKDYSRAQKIRSPEAYCSNLVVHLRYRAKATGLLFNVTAIDLLEQWNKQEGLCYYTGQELDLSKQTEKRNSPHPLFPSVDKQIPSLGYVKGNLIWCICVVNRMKSDLTHEEFVEFCSIVFKKFG